MPGFNESIVEDAALAWLAGLGYVVFHGSVIAPGEAQAERTDPRELVLIERLRAALVSLNPKASPADLAT